MVRYQDLEWPDKPNLSSATVYEKARDFESLTSSPQPQVWAVYKESTNTPMGVISVDLVSLTNLD